MEPTQAPIDHLYRNKVLRARGMTPEERWFASLEHSEVVAETMKEGVRAQFPGASEIEVLRIIRERLNRIRRAGRRS